jgi:hypothetical protein
LTTVRFVSMHTNLRLSRPTLSVVGFLLRLTYALPDLLLPDSQDGRFWCQIDAKSAREYGGKGGGV